MHPFFLEPAMQARAGLDMILKIKYLPTEKNCSYLL